MQVIRIIRLVRKRTRCSMFLLKFFFVSISAGRARLLDNGPLDAFENSCLTEARKLGLSCLAHTFFAPSSSKLVSSSHSSPRNSSPVKFQLSVDSKGRRAHVPPRAALNLPWTPFRTSGVQFLVVAGLAASKALSGISDNGR